MYIYWKNPYISGPALFKPMFFKGQLYIYYVIWKTLKIISKNVLAIHAFNNVRASILTITSNTVYYSSFKVFPSCKILLVKNGIPWFLCAFSWLLVKLNTSSHCWYFLLWNDCTSFDYFSPPPTLLRKNWQILTIFLLSQLPLTTFEEHFCAEWIVIFNILVFISHFLLAYFL